jgi:putative protease
VKKLKTEILAPVGGQEQLIAAVRCGADAVYLGAGGFNARQNAENFGNGTLLDAVSYCHTRGVDVHVTVNTLVMDSELDSLDRTVDEIAAAGADAAIIQDLAVMRRFRDCYPTIKRHASTQMTVHDLDGALMLRDMGFDRVVLSRELSLKEIEFITARCGIETEVFIHGALCMCMSGACYLSSMLGGRSGNRGLCAQPCRLNFESDTREYALSLKDMSHIDKITELKNAGVTSFKIEGRMKRPEYVAAAVTACKKAINGEKYDLDSLRAVFSRSGFTDGYITGKRDDMFGIRRKEDVTAAAGILGELSSLYRAERQSVPVAMELNVKNDGSSLTVLCDGDTVKVSGERPQQAINRPLDEASAREKLSKTGGTPYFVSEFSASIEDGLMLPVSALNAMRRDALEKLSELRGETRPHEKVNVPNETSAKHEVVKTELRGRFLRADSITDAERFDRIILPIDEIIGNSGIVSEFSHKIIAELPPLLFDGDRERLYERLSEIKAMGIEDAYCDNLYGIRVGRELGFNIHGGFGLNVMNTDAIEEYEKLGLSDITVSFELQMSKISGIRGTLPRGIVAYGRLPLMKFRSCPVKGKKGCGECNGVSKLTDRKNAEFTVVCSNRRFGTLLNSVPLYISDKSVAKVDFEMLYFTTETRDEISAVVKSHVTGASPSFQRTGGLYYRGIQ